MEIKINTNVVRNTACQIASVNQRISHDFSCVEHEISNLNRNWEGTGSYVALKKFNNIKSTYCDNRFKIINDMVNFMKKQVGDGYEQTEKAIFSAASAFK